MKKFILTLLLILAGTLSRGSPTAISVCCEVSPVSDDVTVVLNNKLCITELFVFENYVQNFTDNSFNSINARLSVSVDVFLQPLNTISEYNKKEKCSDQQPAISGGAAIKKSSFLI